MMLGDIASPGRISRYFMSRFSLGSANTLDCEMVCASRLVEFGGLLEASGENKSLHFGEMLEESPTTITNQAGSSYPTPRPTIRQLKSQGHWKPHHSTRRPFARATAIADDAGKPFPHINEASRRRRQQSAISAFRGARCGATRASGNHLVIIIIVSVCAAATLLLSTAATAMGLHHFGPLHSSISSLLDGQPRADDAAMPDSVYKQAPLLFGADIIGDYYTETAAPSRAAPAKPIAPTTSRTRQVSATSSGQSGRKEAMSKAKSVPGTRLKRNPTSGSPPANTKEANDSTATKDMAGQVKGGVSVDHMLSSLGLVVEAMKQQTMAMQMMAAASSSTKGATSADKSTDVRAFLESFGEMLTNLRPTSAPVLSRFNHQDSRDVQVDLNLPGKVAGLSLGSRKGGDAREEQLNNLVEHPIPTTSTPTPTSTTTTTTTPPSPSTSTSSPTTTSTTTKSPEPAVPDTTTAAPKKKVVPDLVGPSKSYKAHNSKGWRRLVPFDYYPPSSSDDSGELPRMLGSLEATSIEAADQDGPTMIQPVVPDMLHSFGGAPGYGGSSQPENGLSLSVGMPAYSLPKSAPKQQAPSNQKYQPQLSMEQALMLMQPFMNQHKLKAAVVPASAAEYLVQAAMSGIQHIQPEGLAMEMVTPKPVPSVSAVAAAMVEQMQQQQQLQQMQLHMKSQQMLDQQQPQQQHSDEIPKSPAALQLAALMNGQKQGTKSTASLKIGERPQFDAANFQMLDAGSGQQRKITMMMLQKALDIAQQQSQQQATADTGDLSATASSEVASQVVKSVPKPHQDQEQRVKVVKVIQQVAPPPSSNSGNKQPSSFSILGGRFKITPHTQVLHFLLEPSKMILQQALGGLMPGPLQVQLSGGAGALPVKMPAPVHQRLPRRVYSLAGSAASSKSSDAAKGGKQKKASRLLGKKVSARKQVPKKSATASAKLESRVQLVPVV